MSHRFKPPLLTKAFELKISFLLSIRIGKSMGHSFGHGVPQQWYSSFKTSLSLAVTPRHRFGRSGDSKSLPGAHKTSGLRAAGCGFLQWQSTEHLRLRSHFAVLAHGTTPSQLSGSQQTIGAGPLNSRGLLLGLLPLWRGAVIYKRR